MAMAVSEVREDRRTASAFPKWYRISELAMMFDRSRRTIRRHLGPYKHHCRLVREGKHPRRILIVPPHVARAIEQRLVKS